MREHLSGFSVSCRQVFVKDAPSAVVPQRESVGTAEDVDLLRGSASAQVAAPTAERDAEGDQMPEWWNPSPALHVSLYYRQEVRQKSYARHVEHPLLGERSVQGCEFDILEYIVV